MATDLLSQDAAVFSPAAIKPIQAPLNLIPVGLKEAALDSPTFRATATHFGDQIEAVLHTGTSFKFDNVLIPVERNGVLTDTYFTYSFSPILEANDNTVAGVLCMAQDVTPAGADIEDALLPPLLRCKQRADLRESHSLETL